MELYLTLTVSTWLAFSILCYFNFWQLVFGIAQEWNMLFCRIMAFLGVIGLIYCNIRLFIIMRSKTGTPTPEKFHISASLKILLLIFTLISSAGYFFRIPFIFILWDYDFALNYSTIYEVWSDILYIPLIIIYMWMQLIHISYFFPTHQWNEWDRKIFAFVLTINFWQKWLFESLEAKEIVCEKLIEDNRNCSSFYHYHTNIDDMSTCEQEALSRMEMITPLTFSSTLELLLAFFVVLSLNKPATNIHASKINLVEAQQHENISFSSPIIDISLDADIDPLIPIPQEEQRIIQLFEHPLKLLIAIFVFICVIVLSLACIIVKTVASFHDETHIRESWYFMYDILKLTSVFISCMVTGSLWYKYRKLIPENRRILIRAVKVNWQIIGSVFNSIFGFLKSQEPDLLLLKITLIISVIAGCTSMFFELWGFLDSENYPLMQFLFWILPNILSLTSFYLNVKLLNILLAIDERILIATSKNKFTFFMAIYQMTKNFIRAIMYVIIFLDHKVPYEPRSDFLDEVMLSTQSLYPFKPSMNIFSALCWAHFIHKLWRAGAKKLFITPDNAIID